MNNNGTSVKTPSLDFTGKPSISSNAFYQFEEQKNPGVTDETEVQLSNGVFNKTRQRINSKNSRDLEQLMLEIERLNKSGVISRVQTREIEAIIERAIPNKT